MNPKVLKLLNGKYGSDRSQKGLVPADFIEDNMIGQMIAITHHRQSRYTTDTSFMG